MAWYWWVIVAVTEAVFIYHMTTKGYFDRFLDFCSKHFLIMFPIYMAVIILLSPGFGLLAWIVVICEFPDKFALAIRAIRNRPH